VTSTDIAILDPITFLPGSATLDARSVPILDAVASTLRGNPSLELVAVQTEAGDALSQFRARLAADRADVVIGELVARGVARVRLVPDPVDGPLQRTSFFVIDRND